MKEKEIASKFVSAVLACEFFEAEKILNRIGSDSKALSHIALTNYGGTKPTQFIILSELIFHGEIELFKKAIKCGMNKNASNGNHSILDEAILSRDHGIAKFLRREGAIEIKPTHIMMDRRDISPEVAYVKLMHDPQLFMEALIHGIKSHLTLPEKILYFIENTELNKLEQGQNLFCETALETAIRYNKYLIIEAIRTRGVEICIPKLVEDMVCPLSEAEPKKEHARDIMDGSEVINTASPVKSPYSIMGDGEFEEIWFE